MSREQVTVQVYLTAPEDVAELEREILSAGLMPIRFRNSTAQQMDVPLGEHRESDDEDRAALTRAVTKFEAVHGPSVTLIERHHDS